MLEVLILFLLCLSKIDVALKLLLNLGYILLNFDPIIILNPH